jgi:outer membrane murein-binding lipoprotein Lpp
LCPKLLDHSKQLERIRSEARLEINNERQRLEHDRDRWRESEAKAVHEAARLQGRLEAMEELLDRAKPSPKSPKKPRDRTVKGNGASTSERNKKDGAEKPDGAN